MLPLPRRPGGRVLLRTLGAFLVASLFGTCAQAQSGWQNRDIGTVAAGGRINSADGTSTWLTGSGADIWDNADEFFYRYQAWNGDGEFIARVIYLSSPANPWAKAAVMVRESLAADSAHAMICVTPGNGTAFQYRSVAGGSSASSSPTGSATLPVWLRLVRSGATVTGFTSSNGTTWTQAGAIALSSTSSVFVGLAVTAHNDGQYFDVHYDNIAFAAPPSSPPGAPVITAKSAESVPSGYLYTYQVVASNSPTSYSATGLPAGLTLDPATGKIRGVCGFNGGSYSTTLRATNSAGTGTATQVFIVSGSGPIEMPAIESVTLPADGTYHAGDTLIFQLHLISYYGPIDVTGRPRFAFTLGGNPRFANYAWGSGQPYHTYTYTVTAADAGAAGLTTGNTVDLNGGTMQDSDPLWCALNMTPVTSAGIRVDGGTVNPTAVPVLLTPNTASGLYNRDFALQIVASNAPTSYAMTLGATPTLPLGLTINSASGLISGKLQASGTYTLTLAATNAIGTGTKTLTLTIPHLITAVTMPAARTYHAGDILSFRVTFSNPVRITGAPTLPLTIGSTSRAATYAFGSDRDHTFNYTVQVGDVDLDGSIPLGLNLALNGGTIRDAESGANFPTALPRNSVATGVIVDAPGATPPTITSAATASGTVGAPFSYTITATNSPTSFNATGLPPGLTVNTASGAITGTPTAAGNTNCQIFASNSGGTGSTWITLAIGASGGAWDARDIGAVAAAGSASESGGVLTLRASGADIWENVDEFHFRSQILEGNGEVIARVLTLENTHPWAKVGLMFRESLDPGSRHVWACVSHDFGTALQYRPVANGQTNTTTPTGTTVLPVWLRLVRSNDTHFDYYTSIDGATWTYRAGVTLSTFASRVYVGVALTSHNDGVVNTATLDNVRVNTPSVGPPAAPSLSTYAQSAYQVSNYWSAAINETGSELERSLDGATFSRIALLDRGVHQYYDTSVNPLTKYYYRVRLLSAEGNSPYSAITSATTPDVTPPPGSTWNFTDVGTVGVAGSNSSSDNTITISGSGADIWETADGFRFVYRQIGINAVVEARVSSLTNTNAWAKAGVMIRQSVAADARNVFTYVTPNNGVATQARLSTGTQTEFRPGPWVGAPYWVRLVRASSRITAYASPDGTTWTEIGAFDVPMTDAVLAGFAVTSHDNSVLATAVFTDPFAQ